MIKQTLEIPQNKLSTKVLCSLAGVSRSGFYNWLKKASHRESKEQQDQLDFALIMKAYNFRGYTKGVLGIRNRLLHMGIRMNHKKIRRLMKKYDLRCPIRQANPYRRMAKALQTNAVADNFLKREFKSHGPRTVFLTDITYLPVLGNFVYLSVILDAFTDQVMSYVLSSSLEVDFVLMTVQKMFEEHEISINSETLIHSDQGCHYTSTSFQKLVKDYGLRQSMSRRGNCWDNAPQESFFGHMKEELRTHAKNWKTIQDVQTDIDDWMDYYNNDRCKTGLGGLTPNEFYIYITTGEYPPLMLQPNGIKSAKMSLT